jgi:hypothetical protein
MLSTDHDGEIVAAQSALKRTLASHGLDLHDVIDALTEEPQSEPHWYNKASFCFRHQQRLSDWEKGFIDTLLGWRGEPTEKQKSRLNAIYDRLRAQGARA